MMTGLFILLVVMILLAMKGWHRAAITVFCINLVLSILMFCHHITQSIPVNL